MFISYDGYIILLRNPWTYEANDSEFNWRHIMHCIVRRASDVFVAL